MEDEELQESVDTEEQESVSPENETKAEKFVRLAEGRVNKSISALERIGALANRSSYEYTEEQIDSMFGAIYDELDEVKSKFVIKEKPKGFSFN